MAITKNCVFNLDNRVLSYWLTHVLPFLILAALKCSNSILVRGVFIDAEGANGTCVDVPINYIQLHFQRERSKKQIWQQIFQDMEAQSSLIDGNAIKQSTPTITSDIKNITNA